MKGRDNSFCDGGVGNDDGGVGSGDDVGDDDNDEEVGRQWAFSEQSTFRLYQGET